jgi:hypothetical protein
MNSFIYYIDKVIQIIVKPKVLNIRYIDPTTIILFFAWFRQSIVLPILSGIWLDLGSANHAPTGSVDCLVDC